MPTVDFNLTLFSIIHTISENLKASKVFTFHHFSSDEQFKFHIHLDPLTNISLGAYSPLPLNVCIFGKLRDLGYTNER